MAQEEGAEAAEERKGPSGYSFFAFKSKYKLISASHYYSAKFFNINPKIGNSFLRYEKC